MDLPIPYCDVAHMWEFCFSFDLNLLFAGILQENVFLNIQHPRLLQIADEVLNLLLNSRSSNTKKKYISGFNQWKDWTDQFEEVSSFPASPLHLALRVWFSSKFSLLSHC